MKASTCRGLLAGVCLALAVPEFNILDFGAIPGRAAVSTAAIQAAVEAAAALRHRADVVVPAGDFVTGSFTLASHVHLRLDRGAVLLASNVLADYPEEGWNWVPAVLDTANATDTGVYGAGTFDGQALPLWVDSYDPINGYLPIKWDGIHGCMGGECRPNLVRFADCDDVTVQGVTLQNSPDWTFLCRRCNNLHIADARFLGDHQWPNNDGMDIESGRNITIENVEIDTGDDGICISSGNTNPLRVPWWPLPAGDVSDLAMRNVSIRSKSSALKFSAIHWGEFTRHNDLRDMTFDNIRIWDSSRGIGFQQRTGEGSMHNLRFENITIETLYPTGSNWWGSGEPIWITSVPQSDDADDSLTGTIFDVHFKNVRAIGENGVLLSGLSQGAGVAVTFENVTLEVGLLGNTSCAKGTAEVPTGCRDYRPLGSVRYPSDTSVVPTHTAVIYMEGNGNVTFKDTVARFRGPPQPYWVPPSDGGLCMIGSGSLWAVDTNASPGLHCTSRPTDIAV